MYNNEKHDWETREDAETLRRYQEISGNAERLNKAKSCIKDSVNSGKKALGIPTPPLTGRENKATIMKMKVNY